MVVVALGAAAIIPFLHHSRPSPQINTDGRLKPAQLRIVNYYPASGGWDAFWLDYSHAQTAQDFANIASLHANAVRIIVQPSAVGYPLVTTSAAEKFADVLATARAAGLAIQLTLFDHWNSYGQLAPSKTWVESLLGSHRDDPVIALVELQNEIPVSNDAAVAWASVLLPYLSEVLPGVPRTETVASNAGAPAALALLLTGPVGQSVDVIDVHLFGDWNAIVATLTTAKELSRGRVVIVGEAGVSTYPTSPGPGDEAQRFFFDLLTHLCARLGIPQPSPWIYSDLTRNQFSPSSPADLDYGLRRSNGSWKPAATLLERRFAAEASGAPLSTLIESNDGGFENESSRPFQQDIFGAWYSDNADLAQILEIKSRVGWNYSKAAVLGRTQSVFGRVASFYQILPVYMEKQVTASALVDARAGGGSNRIALAFFSASGQFLANVDSRGAVGGWAKLTVTAQVPAGTTTVQIHLKSSGNTGSVYFDNVAVSSTF